MPRTSSGNTTGGVKTALLGRRHVVWRTREGKGSLLGDRGACDHVPRPRMRGAISTRLLGMSTALGGEY